MATEVTFTQPDKSEHIYRSEDPNEGFEVTRKEDKTWSVDGPDGFSKEGLKSRAEAFRAVTEQVKGASDTPEGEDGPAPTAEEKANLISQREFNVLKVLQDANGAAVSLGVIQEKANLDMVAAMSVVASMARRKFADLSEEGAKLTELGEVPISKFVPKAKPVRERKGKPDRDPNAPRTNPAESKYGPRPDGIGPAPTDLEYAESRLDNAEASLRFAVVVRRRHPYSPITEKKLRLATERRDEIQKLVEELRAGPEGEKVTDETNETLESVSTDAE